MTFLQKSAQVIKALSGFTEHTLVSTTHIPKQNWLTPQEPPQVSLGPQTLSRGNHSCDFDHQWLLVLPAFELYIKGNCCYWLLFLTCLVRFISVAEMYFFAVICNICIFTIFYIPFQNHDRDLHWIKSFAYVRKFGKYIFIGL